MTQEEIDALVLGDLVRWRTRVSGSLDRDVGVYMGPVGGRSKKHRVFWAKFPHRVEALASSQYEVFR